MAGSPSRRPRGPRRRFWAPEVVQTSAMDCGPAALKCLLQGFGVSASYGRLREACQTSVDGTSIDTLESVAGLLGLEAEQIMHPAEHVLAPEADALPAIAVVRLPSGMTHFVVVWRRVGPYVQVMDPARGRRWMRVAALQRDLLLHTQAVPAEAFAAFAAEDVFRGPLRARVARLVGARRARDFAPSMGEGDWPSLARFESAVRAVESLAAAGVLRRGAEAHRLLQSLAEPSSEAASAASSGVAVEQALAAHAAARLLPPPKSDDPAADSSAGPQVAFTGAVLVRVGGKREQSDAERALPPDLAAALTERPPSLWRSVVGLGSPRTAVLSVVLSVLAAIAAAGTMIEVILTRPMLMGSGAAAGGGVSAAAGAPASGASAFLLVCAVVAGLLAVELPLALGSRSLGRSLDHGLRRAFLRKLPRLGDRYFSSRPVSDMAERAHLLHRVRLLPGLAAQLARAGGELFLMSAAIAWLDPRGAPLAFGLFAFACLAPLVAVPALAERDLRLRTHSGSLMRFYLDGLLGLSAVRTHGAEPAVVREHDRRLGEWRRAGRDMIRTSLTVEAVVLLAAALGAGVLVVRSLGDLPPGPARAPTGLLLLFFALGLPTQAARLIALWRQLPDHRNVTLRLIEPLGAPEERAIAEPMKESGPPPAAEAPPVDGGAGPAGAGAATLAFRDVSVEAGGHRILDEVSLDIAAGSHVAVIGASGAGKSSLVGLLLGFHRPVSGQMLVDGQPLHDGEGRLAALRSSAVWVEPGVQLWNRSLAHNIGYGAASAPAPIELARALEAAELAELVQRLPVGTETSLGEGGGLLSGGEGQRVRLARELVRVPSPRLVLLDEPFRGLDRGTRLRLLERVRARWAGATLLFVTHDIEHAARFPRVLVIDGGRVVEDGSPVDLGATAGSRYRRLFEAEGRVRAARWSPSLWRRVVVRDGGVHSQASSPVPSRMP